MQYGSKITNMIKSRALALKVLHFILSDDDFEIKSKIYSFNLRLVLKHILHFQDVFFRNLLFTLLF